MKQDKTTTELVKGLLARERFSLARLITIVEQGTEAVPEIMHGIYPRTGRAHCIGITGPPGAGKSTLVDCLISLIRAEGCTVGVVAVDPTSPFSHGAVLGDRIRMQRHYLDEGVFIRSMATRGSHGGLPRTAKGVIKLLDAYGVDFVIVETVGVGQAELDIMRRSDTTVVVLMPGAGDTVQAMKAGILEIADIFVVNKADLKGAAQIVNDLELMLEMSPENPVWKIPVIKTQANQNQGVDRLFLEIDGHRRAQTESGGLGDRRRTQRRDEVLESIQTRIQSRLLGLVEQDDEFAAIMSRVESGELDPYAAVEQVFTSQMLLQRCLLDDDESRV